MCLIVATLIIKYSDSGYCQWHHEVGQKPRQKIYGYMLTRIEAMVVEEVNHILQLPPLETSLEAQVELRILGHMHSTSDLKIRYVGLVSESNT